MSENIKKINEFIALFLCTASAIIIIFTDVVTEKFGISGYMERDEKGIIDQIVKNIVMFMYLTMSVGFMLIFSRYSKVE
jgi:hypothetical protein